jgi:hypothetical protein
MPSPLILALVLSMCLVPGRVPGGAQSSSSVIRDARVFDGDRVLDAATVVVRDGLIVEGPAEAGHYSRSGRVRRASPYLSG